MAEPQKQLWPKQLPPTDEDLKLAKAVNKMLGGPTVNFFRSRSEDERTQYGVVFSYGSVRKVVISPAPFFNEDEIVKDVRAWIKAR